MEPDTHPLDSSSLCQKQAVPSGNTTRAYCPTTKLMQCRPVSQAWYKQALWDQVSLFTDPMTL